MFSALTEIQVSPLPTMLVTLKLVKKQNDGVKKSNGLIKREFRSFLSKVPSSRLSFRSFLHNDYESISLKPTNPDELQDICNSFKELR